MDNKTMTRYTFKELIAEHGIGMSSDVARKEIGKINYWDAESRKIFDDWMSLGVAVETVRMLSLIK